MLLRLLVLHLVRKDAANAKNTCVLFESIKENTSENYRKTIVNDAIEIMR